MSSLKQVLRFRRIDHLSNTCGLAFQSGVHLAHRPGVPPDDVDVVRKPEELERPDENRATDAEARASNDTFQSDVE